MNVTERTDDLQAIWDADSDDPRPWHIIDDERGPDYGLCGKLLTGPVTLPPGEVPDEDCCPVCLRIENARIERW